MKMAESITEPGSFTQDLFSPLQFCEVVEEGQQHRQQLQQLHRQQSLSQQINPSTTPQTSTSTHVLAPQQQTHEQSLQQVQSGATSQASQQSSSNQSKQHNPIKLPTNQALLHPVKQEESQSNQQLIEPQITKSLSSMEIFLTSPQPVNIPLLALPQPTINSHLYQVQLGRQHPPTIPQLQLNSLHLQNSSQGIQIDSHLQQALNEATVVGISSAEGFTIPISSSQIVQPSSTSVASQSTQTDQQSPMEDDEPEIIFSSAKSPKIKLSVNSEKLKNGDRNSSSSSKSSTDVKPVPIKKTWRRPWKKKKEREKRQPVKRARKVRRKRVVMPKKHTVSIDPRNGPAIDTARTVIQRQSENQINQLKQKRQRIKLNRNSGREYINRLGKTVCARKIGSPCNCPLKCWDRMGSKVLEIFNNFWDLCDFNLQNSYLFTCLKLCDVKRRYTKKPAEESRRQNTFEYFVRISGKHFRVCKKAFMSSHGLTSDKRLRTLFTQMKDGALIPEPDRRGKHLRPNKPHNGHLGQSNIPVESTSISSKLSQKSRNRTSKKRPQHARIDTCKQTMYTPPPTHTVSHIHAPPPPPPAHGTTMQEAHHAYIPNGDIYFPGHYLETTQAAMGPPHMNQIPSCQKMLEAPAYFMAGMKENTFHQ